MSDLLSGSEVGRYAQMKEFDGEGRDVTIKSLNKLYVGDGTPPVEKEITLKDGTKLAGVNRSGYTYRLIFRDHAADKERMLNVMYDDFLTGLKETKARPGLRGTLKRSNEDGKWLWKFYENPITQTIQTTPTPAGESPTE